MGSLRLIVGLVAALVIASFGVVNMTPVHIAYYKGALEIPLFYALLAVFAAGFVLAWLGGALDRLRFQRRVRGLKREVTNLEKDLTRAKEDASRLLPAAPEAPAPDPARSLEPGGAPSPAPAAAETADPEEGKHVPEA